MAVRNALLGRGAVTDAFVQVLEDDPGLIALGVLVGDGLVPDDAGWQQGQPGVGSFRASVTVSTGEAAPRNADPVNARHSSWTAMYGLRVQGAARKQADDAADVVRAAALGLIGATVPARDGSWKVSDVVFARLAPVRADLGTKPPLWIVDDSVGIWLERERT